MIQRINVFFCASIVLGTSLLLGVQPASAFGCQFPNGTCQRVSGVSAAAADVACLSACNDAAQTGCTRVDACSGSAPTATSSGNGVPNPAQPGSTPAPDANAKVVVLDNPIATNDIQELVGVVLGKTFGIIGTLAVGAFIFGGFLWLTAAGSEEKVKKGGQVMVYATIGIVVVFSSYAILNTILQGLTKDTFLDDTDPTRRKETLPYAAPVAGKCKEAYGSQGFDCRDIDQCDGVGSGTVDQKRTQCETSGGKCFVGVCPGSRRIVCCKAK